MPNIATSLTYRYWPKGLECLLESAYCFDEDDLRKATSLILDEQKINDDFERCYELLCKLGRIQIHNLPFTRIHLGVPSVPCT